MATSVNIPTLKSLGIKNHSKWRESQYDAFRNVLDLHIGTGGTYVIEAPTGCHAKDQLIMLSSGELVPVQSIKQGQMIMGWDSIPRRVINTVCGYGNMYRITPVKGDPFVVNEDHILTLIRTNNNAPRETRRRDCKDGDIVDVCLSEYILWSKSQKHLHKLFRTGTDLCEKSLIIDPYFLGIMLGDGSIINGIKITTPDEVIADEIYIQTKKYGLECRISNKYITNLGRYSLAKEYSIHGRKGGFKNPISIDLAKLGLYGLGSGEKFIPLEYKTSSRSQRLEILAGLIDTDGSLTGNCYDYISKSEKLANDVVYISRSLGFAAYVAGCKKCSQSKVMNDYFRVTISGDLSEIPCRVPYKVAQKRKQKKSVLRTGFKYEYIGKDYYYGFSLDGDGRFLLGDFTVTHNTGKSLIAATLGAYDHVTVFVHNLGLLKQYRDLYDFKIIMGKPEYVCVMPSKVESWQKMYNITPTAADCHYQDMYKCPHSSKCPYVQAREEALQAKRTACTYKYACLSEPIRKRPGILVCDEGHEFYDELLSIAAFRLDAHEASNFNFDAFPLFGFGQGGNGDLLEGNTKSIVKNWFKKNIEKISVVDLFEEMTPNGVKNKKMFDKMSSGERLLSSDQPLFYKCNKPAETYDWRIDNRQAKVTMEIRSLDVTEMIKSLTLPKKTTVIMSATIGDPKPLMNQIGITDFKYKTYPHPVPKDKRPIYDLGMEKMTKANLDSKPSLYSIQANRIADFIEWLDPSWRGIVLTTSNYKITQLRTQLQKRLNGRVHIPTVSGLNNQITEFIKDKTPGKVAVVTIQGWGSGLSLEGNIARLSVIAGVPYVNPSDRFDQLRTSTQVGRNYAFYKAYCSVVQGNGRVSRNEKEPDGSFMLNVGALADGSATTPMALHSYSAWYREAIVKWEK